MQELYKIYWNSWLTPQDFKNLAAEKLNCIRLPVYHLDFMDTLGNWRKTPAGDTDFTMLDSFVVRAREQGMYTIVDLHGAPGSQNGQDHSGRVGSALLYSDPKYLVQLRSLWRGIAGHCKNIAAVAGYDLLNEPSERFPNNMGSSVVAIYDSLYRDIRAIDTNHIIIMEGIWGWGLLPRPSAKGWQNVMYEFHWYNWNGANDINSMKTFIDNNVADANTNRPQYNVPALAGEFTMFSLAEAWTYGLTKFTQANLNWTVWTYKVKTTGSNWGMYTAKNPNPNIPNLNSDTYEQIAQKWGAWDTPNYFTRNATVCNAMKAAATLLGEPKRPLPYVQIQKRMRHANKRDDISISRRGNSFSVYPVSGGPYGAMLLSQTGRVLRKGQNVAGKIEIHAEGVPPGIYLLTITRKHAVCVSRPVIMR
jgi:aryl-phospho-beta-D-glucosidase BglC (GH1 family)